MRGALLLNAGRGTSIVTDELVPALQDGRVRGAGLDVTDPEPLPPGHPLWTMPNVIITPHYGGVHPGYDEEAFSVFCANLERWTRGQPLLRRRGQVRGLLMPPDAAVRPRILVGTSGYSYEDWIGPFYPPGTARTGFPFPVCARVSRSGAELQLLPAAESAHPGAHGRGHAARVHVRHEGAPEHDARDRGELGDRTSARSARESSPWWRRAAWPPFSSSSPTASATRRSRGPGWRSLCEKLEGLPLAVEFRKSEWQKGQVLEGLHRRGVSLVSVDEPDLPKLLRPTAETTGSMGYVRFHGRNKEAWWTGDNASRYDYLYSRDELEEWVQRIRRIIEGVPLLLLFFNNHWRGNAAQNAREMRLLLQERGLM